MALWSPAKEWRGENAYIIGGGSSLRGFDFSKLKGANTIGCNEAFRLGGEIIKICLFSDISWFHKRKWELEQFPGRVVAITPTPLLSSPRWLLQMIRVRDSFSTGPTLGWNYSTGAAAVNLAVTLGATRIHLLGFDMCRNKQNKSHWHDRYPTATKDESFARFIKGFDEVQRQLKRFPGVSLFNVTDGTSCLTGISQISFEDLNHRLLNEHHLQNT